MSTEFSDWWTESRSEELDRAFGMLEGLVDWAEIDAEFPLRENAVSVTAVVLFLLVFQRMSPDSTLEAAVKRLVGSSPGFLPKNKRVTGKTLSENTAGCGVRRRSSRKAPTRRCSG